MNMKGILNSFVGNKKTVLKLVFILIFTGGLVYLLFLNVDIDDLINIFNKISWSIIIFPFLFYLSSHFFRTLRIYLILEKKVSFQKIVYIVFINNFWNSLLPLRLGELSYIFLLKKENVEVTKGAFTLGTLRLFDIVAIFIFFSVALFFTTLSNYFFNLFVISFFIFILILLILIVFFRGLIFNFIKRLDNYFKNSSLRMTFLTKILNQVIGTLEHFIILKSKIMIFNMFILSLLVWFFALLTGYFIMHYLMGISFFVVVISLCFVMLTYILPIQGLMGFGTTEGAWALVLIMFGFTKEQSIAAGLAFHLLSMFYTIILGLVGYLFRKIIYSNCE